MVFLFARGNSQSPAWGIRLIPFPKKKNDLSNFPYIFVSFVFDFIYLCSKRVTVIYLLSFSL